MEHHYQKPEKGFVEDSLDVAALFIQSTKHFVEKALDNFDVLYYETESDEAFEGVSVEFDESEGKLKFTEGARNKKGHYEKITVKTVTTSDPDYMEYLKWFLDLGSLRS